jgi:shikimate dehydrogenase
MADLRAWPEAAGGVMPPLRLAVFGDPVAHSASPPMQNAALAGRGIAARYTRIHVRPDELAEALDCAARHSFLGVNLTIPHKEAALALVDVVDPVATSLGVINTVRFDRSGSRVVRHGYNTDGPGFERAVRTELGVALGTQRVLILGAGGGAGRALARQCALAGCPRVVLVNRTAHKADALAAALGGAENGVVALRWEALALHSALETIDLIVNASAVGLDPVDSSPLPAEVIPRHVRVFDTVYRADGSPTPLQAAARRAGAQAVDGRALLLHQGALAFEHWFGGEAPLAEMRRALEAPVHSRSASLTDNPKG